MIDNSIMPFVSTIGFGGIVGFLSGFALKRIMKILAVIARVFFAALLYLVGVLSTITSTATTTNATSTIGVGMGPIQAILGNNSTAAASAILPITSTMTNLSIPLTGGTAIGFTPQFELEINVITICKI